VPRGELDYSKLTDQEVVAQARAGRETAYRELIGRYERPVFSIIYRLVRDRELAEDLAQDTINAILEVLNQIDPKLKFSSWIFKIAHNTAIDRLRKREVDTLSLDGSPNARTADDVEATRIVVASTEESPEEYAASREIGTEIERALARLRPEYRTAIMLWHIEDRPYEEIAEIMEIPLGTVKTFIHRARNELRKHLAHLRA